MSRRAPIMIGSKMLHECSINEIVDVASHPLRKRWVSTEMAPFYQNRAVITAFAAGDERTTSEVIAHYPDTDPEWSEQFVAFRVGEALGWALENGIVERVVDRGHVLQHRWRLVHTEQQFERIGRGVRQRAIRIHNAGPLQAENTKLWTRELKARERRRIKELAKIKSRILFSLRQICRAVPYLDISSNPTLQQFVVGDIRTISACRDLIESSVDEMTITQAGDLDTELFKLELEVGRNRPERMLRQASPEDLAELDDLNL